MPPTPAWRASKSRGYHAAIDKGVDDAFVGRKCGYQLHSVMRDSAARVAFHLPHQSAPLYLTPCALQPLILLPYRLQVPACCLLIVLRHTFALFVHEHQRVLRSQVSWPLTPQRPSQASHNVQRLPSLVPTNVCRTGTTTGPSTTKLSAMTRVMGKKMLGKASGNCPHQRDRLSHLIRS